MTKYCYNDNADFHGNHEVHKYSCGYLPDPYNRTYLGEYDYDFQAMEAARKERPFWTFDGCAYCMPIYHTS
ncbi:hypothetical protein [Streptococcus parauberis]|uniref:hypothetical protein n=1 Tax=Streptococcus parauberis TaxID=1348 RepID=UPI0005A1C320|nr:hypothetical protein [Streptococcus parauberis]UWM90221.1 hypothetical protein N2A94_06895 [Streptococcus parauberis]